MKKLLTILILALLFSGDINAQEIDYDATPGTELHGFSGYVGSASLDFPTTNASQHSELTMAVKGASIGDPLVIGFGNPLSAIPSKNFSFQAWCSAKDVVTIRFNNNDYADSINPDPMVIRVRVFPRVFISGYTTNQ